MINPTSNQIQTHIDNNPLAYGKPYLVAYCLAFVEANNIPIESFNLASNNVRDTVSSISKETVETIETIADTHPIILIHSSDNSYFIAEGRHRVFKILQQQNSTIQAYIINADARNFINQQNISFDKYGEL